MDCSICLENIEASECTWTPCLHVFHSSCLTEWSKQSTTCPICRTKIGEELTPKPIFDAGATTIEEELRTLADRVIRVNPPIPGLSGYNLQGISYTSF